LQLTHYLRNTALCAGAAILAIPLYALSASPETFIRATGLALVSGLAAFWLVGIIGFIFGIPRVPSSDTTRNQNLGEVSDWLTKIIIGASLVELRSIGRFVADVGSDIGTSSALPAGVQLYTALIVATGTAGFVFFYFWAYMYWQALLERTTHVSDRPLDAGAQRQDVAPDRQEPFDASERGD
jgi:hypothetical protein